MTPFAAQLFRAGTESEQRMLASCQFFECSAISAMAQEMGRADVELGGSEYSLGAQLPAPFTAIEVLAAGGRALWVCEQQENEIRWWLWVPAPDGKPRHRGSSGFILGTIQNTEIHWARFEGDPPQSHLTSQQAEVARSFNLLIEKFLLIINQPGLVDRVERPSDKRIQRIAKTLPGKPDVSKFFECRIRPGQHGEAAGESGVEMPLHYVRKHLRPSSGKWIDGYWRGNADLGIHLKWYSPAPPKGGRA